MTLTTTEIRMLLELLKLKPVYANLSVTVMEQEYGYSSDPEKARLQAKLSMMLEVAHQRERM